MDAATHAHVEERVHPVLSELLNGYVVIGYAPNKDGKNERICIVNGGGDAAIADGLRPFIGGGMAWATVPKPQSGSVTGETEPA
jgi:hypothetical protein